MFNTKRADGRPAWRVVFDMVVEKQPGTVFTFAELEAALETTNRNMVRHAVARATRKLWKAKRSLDSVRGVGFRLLLPLEHEQQSIDFEKAGRRKFVKAQAVMDATDLRGLSNSDRVRFLERRAGMALILQSIDAHAADIAHRNNLVRDLQARMRGDE